MTKMTSFLPALSLCLAVFGTATTWAQTPSPLLGKTVLILNPVPGDNVFVELSGNGQTTTKLADNWVSYSFAEPTVQPHMRDFSVRNDYGQGHWRMLRTGIVDQGGGGAGNFTPEDFQGKDTLWIIVDPSGPVRAAPSLLTAPPKIVNMYNPWETTGPRLLFTGGNKTMLTVEGRCGWFRAYLLKPAEMQLHFEEINGTATYGRTGLGGNTHYDMAAEFARAAYSATGMHLWLDTDLNTWLTAFNDKLGTCQYMMAATVRDFSPDHPDFDFGVTGDFSAPGMVEPDISVNGTERHPKRSAKSGVINGRNIFNDFESWWKTNETHPTPANRSYETCVDIPMDKTGDGLWEYDSFRVPERGFWPVENFTNPNNTKVKASCALNPTTNNWVTGQPNRNMNFCMESHAKFFYQPGQKFVFRGDDDVWVYINDKLVIDLGGVHIPKSDSVDLDKLGLTPGKEYNWDLFYCEREPCGSSLRIKTSIFFRQQRSLFVEEMTGTGGAISVRILRRDGGKGSCAGLGGTDTAAKPAAGLVYRILNVAGTPVGGDLGVGTHHVGITIGVPNVIIDTTKIVGLDAGKYRLVAFDPVNQKLIVEVPFTVYPKNRVVFEPLPKREWALGDLVPVIGVNRMPGQSDTVKDVAPYTLVIPPGLLVFQDAARSQPVGTLGTQSQQVQLNTGANGLDTLWVTGRPDAIADQDYVLSILNSNSVTLTFLVPKNRVELERTPAIDTLYNSVVRLLAANREPGLAEPKREAKKYKLAIPAGLQVYADAALTVRVNTDSLTTAADGWDTLWVTADSTANNFETPKPFILGIDRSVNQVSLTFRMPPLDLPQALSASLYDDDADGIPDRLAVTYDRDISGRLPKAAEYRWPATTAPPVAIADLGSKVTGASLVHRGPMTATPATAGNGIFVSTYHARNRDTTQAVVIRDRMGPVLLGARIALGTAQDTLRLKFSEPVHTGAITGAAGTLFAYKLVPDGAPVSFEPAALGWSADGTEAVLFFPTTSEAAPRAGNLVRIVDGPGLVADAHGNTAGAASLYLVISGVNRSAIETEPYRKITPDAGLLSGEPVVPSRQPITLTVKDVGERTGRMGHLIKTDLGNFAVGDHLTPVRPEQVVFEYEVAYFTNHGLPVLSAKRTVACTDDVYGGDCVKHRGYLFVGWNYSTREGGKVGTGAYVSRLRYAIKVEGKVRESGGMDQVWGVLRQ